jgi:hypothetical protein
MLQQRPNTFAQTNLSTSFFAGDKETDHTFRLDERHQIAEILVLTDTLEARVNQNPDLLKTAGQATGSVEIPTLFIDPHCRSPRRYCQMPWRRQTIVSWR